MQKCKDRTGSKTYIFEPEPDIDQHTDCRNDNCDDRILSHLRTYGRTDIFSCDRRCIYAEVLCQCIIQRLSFVKAQCLCLDDDLVAVFYFLCLYIVIACCLFYNRNDLGIDLFDRIIFVKCYSCRCTTFEFQAVVQCAVSFG